MTGIEARTAMLKEQIVQYEGKLYRISAVIQRVDYRYEPERLSTFAELESMDKGFLLIETVGPKTGYPQEIPIEKITVYEIKYE